MQPDVLVVLQQVMQATGRMPKEDLEIIANVVSKVQPVRTFEVGLLSGSSALAIMGAKPDVPGAMHIACDPYQRRLYNGQALDVIAQAGLAEKFEFMEEESHYAMPRLLLSDAERFDLVFIDGNHKFDYTLVEWFYSDKLLHSGGVILFDDCNWTMVQSVANFVEANCAYRFIKFNERTWAAVKMREDNRSWAEFSPFVIPWDTHHASMLEKARNAKAAKPVTTA